MQVSRILSLGIVYVCYLFIGALLFKKLENKLVGNTFYKFNYHVRLCKLLNHYVDTIRSKNGDIIGNAYFAIARNNCSQEIIDRTNEEMVAAGEEIHIKFIDVWKRVAIPLKLNKFRETEFVVRGEDITEMLLDTVEFSLVTYGELASSCYSNWDWSLDNTILFMGTVATTIGYGHLVPRTFAGRVICVFLAVFAVPLFAILVQSISNLIDKKLITIMTKINQMLKRQIIKIHTMQMIYFACGVVFFIILPSFIFTEIEGWTMLDAIYFCTITLTKIGFGDYVPRMSPPDRLATTVHNSTACLTELIIPSPTPYKEGKDKMPLECEKSVWPWHVTMYFAIYRIGVFFWMILGLSFTGTCITMMVKGLNNVIRGTAKMKSSFAILLRSTANMVGNTMTPRIDLLNNVFYVIEN
ncbi:Oidioi.mRNA.OKI2018_I69.PAR.g9742.t2.cds [Oikopleura dioica]|uniref:Oidioi.mRNA.OKI2018_I69.PAR.g9742.t2.cds n=1 Tax=Oikopleura dioica TaxID=34765 RepID=A0ABN7RQQ4_OIKDI|nr:Oidioi.mRNA.OKI2018_I69.PAR.g9742.t2.cds [Oikopleura dioica]